MISQINKLDNITAAGQCLHYLVASCGGLVALFLRAVSATHSIPSSTPSPVSPLVARVISSRVFSS